MKLIAAVGQSMGIGIDGRLPWHVPEELKLFSKITKGKTLVMGRKTVETLPKLTGRYIICMSRTKSPKMYTKNNITIVDGLPVKDNDTFIAGGAEIYKLALTTPGYVDEVYLSIMKKEYTCDTFFDKAWLRDFVIVEEQEYDDFTHYRMERTTHGEAQYLELMQSITKNGGFRSGRNGVTVSTFNNQMQFDLRNGFPLLTTKKMFKRGIVEELLFFLRGDTNSKILEKKKVNIWKGNTSREYLDEHGFKNREEGVMGPCYGYQWRFFNAPYDEEKACPKCPGIDQLAMVVDMIINYPHSRRIMMTDYNPSQVKQCVLPPCHSVILQFYVDGKELDMFCYNRSQDVFLGVPFNIASSSLLLMVVAKMTKKTPRFLYMTMGDTHIYSDHTDAVLKQITRIPYKFPTLSIPEIESLEDIPKLQSKDFKLSGYKSHGSIKAPMIA